MTKTSHDIIVIGGGAGGLTAASGCAQLGTKIALIEKERLGGDCLYFGCVPSKTLIKVSRVYNYTREFKKFGLPEVKLPPPQITKVMKHVKDVIQSVAVHDSPERFKSLGAEIFFDSPKFLSPNEVELCSGEKLSARTIIIATGSSPAIPQLEGLNEAGFITNKSVFSLTNLPRRLIVIGAGPIGIEIGQAFLRLGSKVTIIDHGPQILLKEDEDMAEVIKDKLIQEGANMLLNSKILRIEKQKGSKVILFEDSLGKELTAAGEEILIAAGRKGNIESLGLENAGIKINRSFIETGNDLSTNRKNILAVGDVNGKFLFTHVAGAEGSIAVRRSVFRLPASMDYNAVPWVTYTDPEIASCGYNEKRAKNEGIDYTAITMEFSDIDRAMAESEPEGKIKILIDRKKRIIGTQIAGIHAGELIIPSILALRNRYKLMSIMSPIFPYPVLSEIHKKAASDFYSAKIFNARVRGILKKIFHYRGKN